MQVERNSVMNRRDEIGVGNRETLRIRNRYERHFAETKIEWPEIRHILPAMRRGEGALRYVTKQRKMELIDVEVEDVEIVDEFVHPVEHEHVIRNGVAHVRIQPQRLRDARHQVGGRYRVSAREQRHVVTEAGELISQV